MLTIVWYSLGLNESTHVLFSIIFICVCLIWGSLKWQNYHFEKLAATFPGPKSLPFIGNALELIDNNPEDILWNLRNLSKTYKSPFRLWLGGKLCVFITKPEDLQIIFNSPKTLEKDALYGFLEKAVGTGLGTAPVTKWKRTRKALAPYFSPKILTSFVPVMNERANIIVQNIQCHCGTGAEVDIFPYFMPAALDTVCESAFGVKINTQLGQNSSFSESLFRVSELLAARLYKPWLHMDWIYEKTSYAKELNIECEAVRRFVYNVIQERRKTIRKTNSSSDQTPVTNANIHSNLSSRYLLDAMYGSHENGSFSFSSRDMIDEALTFLFAGSESTALTNCFCLLMLAMHPEIQEKVFKEQYGIFGNENRPVTTEDIDKMEYTEQVIKETLRLFPTLPFILRSIEEDIKITQEHILPAGSTAVIAPLLTHYDSTLWKQPKQFNPENFSTENVERRHKYSFIAFSGGARGCIGTKYGMMAMKTTISIFIRHFTVSTIIGLKNIKLTADLLLRNKHGWIMKLEPRVYKKSRQRS
nr:PREDICTED: cytochrome P450 4C1-like isoform X1 [Bemisia tabaci]